MTSFPFRSQEETEIYRVVYSPVEGGPNIVRVYGYYESQEDATEEATCNQNLNPQYKYNVEVQRVVEVNDKVKLVDKILIRDQDVIMCPDQGYALLLGSEIALVREDEYKREKKKKIIKTALEKLSESERVALGLSLDDSAVYETCCYPQWR